MIGFREATRDDADAIFALRQRCFPEDDLEKPRPTRMFIAEEDGVPVAHLGFIPQTYVIDGNEYAGALAVDAMTDPAYRKQGLFRRVAAFARDAIRDQYALSTAWQIRPAVLGAMVATGWSPILRAPVFVKPLFFQRSAGFQPAGPPASSRQGERSGRQDAGGPAAWKAALRCLRLALLAQQPIRANLYRESLLLTLREKWRGRHTDPWQYVVANAPKDPPIQCLLRTAAKLANE